ncbi:MAG: transaldolase [bacterium]|nr:transaldolase [bacterium]
MNRLRQLWGEHGQAVWLDFIQRDLLNSGGLTRLIEEDGVRGVTSNPSIFEKAIAGSGDYDAAIDALLAASPAPSLIQLYEALAKDDIRSAADLLRPVYDGSGGSDGFVSLEVSPQLAADTKATVEEARRLWKEVARPNLMIKVPATKAGAPAIQTLIADGINVNATLVFSLAHYEGVAEAYIRGLEKATDPSKIASVASFFVSRLDTVIDSQLEAIGTPLALELRGKAAIANAAMAYGRFKEIFYGDRFAALRTKGAQVQRPLWASTSTKNPAYRDVIYVEELIGTDTVNTLPTATLEAFRDHGNPRASLAAAVEDAPGTIEQLAELDIDLDAVTSKLQTDGVAAFSASWDALMAALDARRSAGNQA